MREGSRKLIKGAAILGAAALVSKLLGAIYRIPYQNIAGDLGLYVYNQVYPVYTILLYLSTSGFPKAISKTVSEKLVIGDHEGAKRVFRISASILFLTGFFFFILLYFLAPYIAVIMAGDEKLTMPIRSISFALLVVPVMAAMRGYFQGHQNMFPTAVSQIIEQLVRVATILILSYWFISQGYGVYYAGSGAVFGAVSGSVASLIVLAYFWFGFAKRSVQQSGGETRSIGEQESAWELIKNLFKIAVPIAAGSLVIPLMQLVDSFSVKNILDWTGFSGDSATWTGILNRGQPLVQFAAFVAAPLSLALLPAISEANARRERRLIAQHSELAIRLTLFIGLPAAVGLAVIAEPVNIFLYRTSDGSITLAVLAFTTIFSTLGITTAGILQGLGLVMRPARNLLIGALFKLIFNFIFIPIFDITGAALATVLAYIVSTTLNMLAVNKYAGTQFNFRKFVVKPLIAVLVMAATAFLLEGIITIMLEDLIRNERILYGIVVTLVILVAALVYGAMLLKTGAIRGRDLDAIPRLGKLKSILRKVKLLKD